MSETDHTTPNSPSPDVTPESFASKPTDPIDSSEVHPDQGAGETDPSEPCLSDKQPTSDQDIEESDVAAQFEAIQKERDQLLDKLLHANADYQNLARRSEKNVINAREQLLLEIAKDLVTVLDHFDHAMEIDPESTTTEGLLHGVTIVRDELLKTLSRFGVQRFEVSAGEPFDPTRHEAMLRQASEDVDSNHVTIQLQPGYILGDKTIRPVKVGVAE